MATGRVPTTANSPLTAKGDLFTYSTAPARLAVGNDGEQIVADSSTSTGLRYIPATVVVNPVLNSAFQIWQRGTSISTASAGYTADRWYGQIAANGTVSRQVTGDTTNLPNIQYCARVQRTAAATTVTDYAINQSMESINSIPYAGKTVTFSFYARRGANFSGASNILNVALVSGTGTDQNLVSGYTGQATPVNSTATLTTTWQRFTYTGTIASTATELAINYYYTSSGTAGAADYYEVTGVQIDIGSVALPFRTNAATIQGELAACQRYCLGATAVNNGYTYFAPGHAINSTTSAVALVSAPVTMRVTPTSISYASLCLSDGSATSAITSLTVSSESSPILIKLNAGVASGLTAYRPYDITANNNTSAYFILSSEL